MTKEHGTLTSVHPAWIASNTDLGAVGAHKVWRDTSVTPNVYRERNDADNAWDDLGSFSTGASPLLHVAFPFAFNTPGLDTGVVVPGWTPAVDDVFYDAWIDVQTAWDGTTPKGDLFFTGGAYGVWVDSTSPSAPIDMTAAASDWSSGLVSVLTGALSQQGTSGKLGTRYVPSRPQMAGPLTLVVSQDGTATGGDPGATQGAAVLHLLVLPA